jgi:hypothetical protein
VSVPADANPADNDFYFVFDQPVTRQTLIVSDDIQAAQPLQRVAAIPSARSAPPTTAEIATPDQLSTVPWEKLSLLLWQAPLPTAEVAEQVQSFVERGGTVVFFAPRVPTADTFAGAQWESWNEPPNGAPIQTWRGDQDLLAHTQSGDSLPVGQLQIRRYCDLTGEYTPLASLRGGATLLGRAPTTRGQVYFCATTPATEDSSLARDGVVFYVMVQRALESGAKSLSEARHLVAGAVALEQATGWRQVAGPPGALSTEFPFYAGVYATDDRLFAVNSSTEEEHASVVADDRTAALFQGLEFARVNDQAGNLAGLINEIWRAFLAAMIVALIVEAVLCLPRITPTAAGAPAGATL